MFLSPDDIEPVRLRLRDYLAPGATYHVGRRSVRGAFHGTLHTHDFAEAVWIERGSVQHLVNGERQLLGASDIVFIRPDDVHTFRSRGSGGFVQMCVAIPRTTLDDLRERYGGDVEWVWGDCELPTTHRLDATRLARLRELSARLVAAPPRRLLLDRVMLELLEDLIGPGSGNALPGWLEQALAQLADDPEALARGTPALAEIAGRTPEHVNRVIREHTGRTATDTVNDIRIARAATALRLTDDPIARVAIDCGVPSLSHFYSLFHTRLGITPRRYRLEHQALA